MPGLGDYGTVAGVTYSQVKTVSPAAAEVKALDVNPARNYLLIVNDSLNEGWVVFGGTASSGSGIPLYPSGGSIELRNEFCTKQTVSIYGNGNFQVMEGV